jgi:hypothetical protein
MSAKNRSPNAMASTPSPTARLQMSFILCSYTPLEHGQGSGTVHSGNPAARFQHRPPGPVHRDTVELAVERGQQANKVPIAALAQNVERPRAVLAAAPRYENPLHAGTS